jgi:hypothetical protein
MFAYVGIDVHRKRSQVAVRRWRGTRQRQRAQGVKLILSVIGGRPAGTPTAFGNSLGAAEERQGRRRRRVRQP